MKIEERQKIIEEIFQECLGVLRDKGADYSGNEDALSNFKINAKRLGMTKYQVWLIYFMKHIDSVCNSIKDNPENPQVHSEPLGGRVTDIINYAAILQCMLEEDSYDDGKLRIDTWRTI